MGAKFSQNANCDSHYNRKLNLAYNNISRCGFLKGRRVHIFHLGYQIFGVKFDFLLKIKCLILFHKIINTGQTKYLLGRIKFSRSFRAMKIIQQRYRTLPSQRHYFIHTTSLSNSLPYYIQKLGKANTFKKESLKLFS